MNVLTTRLVPKPLVCQFVQSQFDWMSGIREVPGWDGGVIFQRRSEADPLTPVEIRGSIVVQEYAGEPIGEFLRTIYGLSSQGGRVIVVGDRRLVRYIVPMTAAGCCQVVTNIRECDKVAEVIRRLLSQQPSRWLDWRDDFWKRLPWKCHSGIR